MRVRPTVGRGRQQKGWWGPWVFALLLLAGSIVLWHLLGAPVWEGGW